MDERSYTPCEYYSHTYTMDGDTTVYDQCVDCGEPRDEDDDEADLRRAHARDDESRHETYVGRLFLLGVAAALVVVLLALTPAVQTWFVTDVVGALKAALSWYEHLPFYMW